MPTQSIRIVVLLSGLAALPALAQDLPGFSYVEACRIDDTSAAIRMVYQGSECETTDALEPRVELDGTGALVIIATKSTADVCTTQMVPNYVTKIIGIAPDTSQLDIMLLNPQPEPQGRETVAVGIDGVDCAAEGESF